MKGTDFKNSHTNQGNEIFEPFDDCLLARHAKSFGQRSGNRFGFDFAIAVKWGLLETVAGKFKRMGGAQLTLLVGIIGSWAFLTLCLGSAAWMIWNRQGFAFPLIAQSIEPASDADAGPPVRLSRSRVRCFASRPGMTRYAPQSTTILTRSRALTWACMSSPLRMRKRSAGRSTPAMR
jgi:hypothetical protein